MRRVNSNFLKIFIPLIIVFIVSYLYFYYMDRYKSKENFVENNKKQCGQIPEYNPIVGPLDYTPTKKICGCIWDNIDVDYNC